MPSFVTLPTLPRGLEPLRVRNFALYWLGFVVSNSGRWVELTGSLWLVYELTDSPLLLGMLGITRALPSIVLSPVAGVLVDRLDQRRVLLITQSSALAASLVLGVLVASGSVEVWHLFLQIAVQSAIHALDAAARQALFPTLISRAFLPEAVTLSVTAGRSAKFVGPIIGGVAIFSGGVAAPYLVNAASSTVLIGAVWMMSNRPLPSSHPRFTFRQDLKDGFGEILGKPVMSGLFKLEVVFSLFQMNEVMITIIAREVLSVGPAGLGGLLAAPALGSLGGIGSLIAFGQPRKQGRFAVLCTLVYAATLILVAVSGNYLMTAVALSVTGFVDALLTITRHSMMQLAVPQHMRGRVMANMATVVNGLGPLSQTQSGLLAGLLGSPLAIGISAGVVGAATAFVGRSSPALWEFRRPSTAGAESAIEASAGYSAGGTESRPAGPG